MPHDFDDVFSDVPARERRTLDAFERRLEERLLEMGARLSSQFLKDTERSLGNSLKRLAERTLAETLRSFERRQSELLNAAFSRATGLPAGAGGLIGDLTQVALGTVFGGGRRTRTSSRETSESLEAADSFRESRSQTQARLAEAVLRGQRNL